MTQPTAGAIIKIGEIGRTLGSDDVLAILRRDLAGPFRVFGNFTDAELLTIVQFIRTGPHGPRENVEGAWPISSTIRERDGSVRVSLIQDDFHGQSVTLERRGDAWRVLKTSFWIV